MNSPGTFDPLKPASAGQTFHGDHAYVSCQIPVNPRPLPLVTKVGPGILVTHSQGGGPDWLTAIRRRQVRAGVAFERGSGIIFPPGEVPPPMPSAAGTLAGACVPLTDFMQLTRIPILIYYGDIIPERGAVDRSAGKEWVRPRKPVPQRLALPFGCHGPRFRDLGAWAPPRPGVRPGGAGSWG